MAPCSGFARLMADRRAVAALEMALALPVLCLILVGLFDVYNYMRAVDLADRAAISLSNLISQRRTAVMDCAMTTDGSYLGTYFLAGEQSFAPLTLSDKGMMIVSAISYQNGKNTVAWQRRTAYRISGVSSAVGSDGGAATLPDKMKVVSDGNDTVVVAEVFYSFDPFASLRPLTSGLPAI